MLPTSPACSEAFMPGQDCSYGRPPVFVTRTAENGCQTDETEASVEIGMLNQTIRDQAAKIKTLEAMLYSKQISCHVVARCTFSARNKG